MARLKGVPTATYDALTRIRAVALEGQQSSLFNPSTALWTLPNLERLRDAFVKSFDKSAASSIVRLRPLLDTHDSNLLLFAELLYAQQFFAALGQGDKVRNVRQVLSWRKTPLELPEWAIEGVSFGLRDNTSFNTDRVFHLAWLVEMLIGWRELLGDHRPLLEDAWRFRAYVHSTSSDPVAQPMQEALLYMMFPDTFENIASREDKWHIREAFPHILQRQPSDNIDADLLAIRWGLSTTFGTGFEFYSNDVAVHWRAGSKTGPLPDVDRDEILAALIQFDALERSKAEWRQWEGNGNYRFGLTHEGKLYPPKHIVHLATKRLKSGFSGGEQTNKYLTDRGFMIVELRDEAQDPQSATETAPAPRAKTPSGYPEIAVARTKSRSEPEPEPVGEQTIEMPAAVPGASKREIAEQLMRDELQAIAERYELEVQDRRVNEYLVDAIVRSKKVRIAEALGELSRDRLKEICRGLELDDAGREKIVLISRILGEQPPDSESPEAPAKSSVGVDAAKELRRMLGSSLVAASPSGDGWPLHADLVLGERKFPVDVYVRSVGGSSRGNPLERRFQNPSQESPIRDNPERYELLLGVWLEQGPERSVIVAFDPYARLDRTTRFSLFMPVSLLEQAADTGFASHENTRGEIIYAFRPENVGRYVDEMIKEGSWQLTHSTSAVAPKRTSEPKISVPPASTNKNRTTKPVEVAKPADSIYIRPQVGMYSAFARLNYKPWFALAEFLDNAIQSYLSNQNELALAGHEGPLIVDVNLDDNEISITDRAGGIAWQHFPRAFSPAHRPEDDTGLSEFGLGMKAAACWFARKWHVRTSALGEPVERTVRFDIPQISKEGVEDLPIEIRPSRETDHFTVITMQDLRVRPKGPTLKKIREHLASIYRVLIGEGVVKLRLTAGGKTEELAYENPPLLEAPYFKTPQERSRLWRQEFEVEIGDKRVTGWAGIMQTGSHSKAGFSVFRRRRLIEGSVGETYRPGTIFGHLGSFRAQRVIGELYVEGFDVTHTKDGIQWHGDEELVLEMIHRQINSPKMPLLEQAEGYRVRKTAATLDRDFGADAVSDTVDALARPSAVQTLGDAIATIKSDPGPAQTSLDLPKPVVMQQKTLSLNITRDGKPWKVTLELVRDPALPFYQTAVVQDFDGGDVISVQVNLDHEFSVRYLNDNEDALQPMLRFVAALALSEKVARDAGLPSAGTIRQNTNQILSALVDPPTN